ncbi:LPS assembly protein LptD, partial [Escherichia coli]|uniref:LPS assembly protein LptD n=1 Tax=Escherichia coli TaxID=562 RepID=UPI00300597BD
LLATHYLQKHDQGYNSRNTTKLDESVNRVMPQFKVDGFVQLGRVSGVIPVKIGLLATHYQQTNLDWYNSRNTTKLDESVNRVMPQFKVDGFVQLG